MEQILNQIEEEHQRRLKRRAIVPRDLKEVELIRLWQKAWVYPSELDKAQLNFIKDWLFGHSITDDPRN